jgi:hypothetical protein
VGKDLYFFNDLPFAINNLSISMRQRFFNSSSPICNPASCIKKLINVSYNKH